MLLTSGGGEHPKNPELWQTYKENILSWRISLHNLIHSDFLHHYLVRYVALSYTVRRVLSLSSIWQGNNYTPLVQKQEFTTTGESFLNFLPGDMHPGCSYTIILTSLSPVILKCLNCERIFQSTRELSRFSKSSQSQHLPMHSYEWMLSECI